MGDYSRFLFATPSFSEGIARILDFGNTLNEYNYSNSAESADCNALLADWNQLGADLRLAINKNRADVKRISKAKASR